MPEAFHDVPTAPTAPIEISEVTGQAWAVLARPPREGELVVTTERPGPWADRHALILCNIVKYHVPGVCGGVRLEPVNVTSLARIE